MSLNPKQHADWLMWRKQKDDYYRHAQNSPIPRAEREGFTGLRYFDFDANAIQQLTIAPDPSREETLMQTSSGSQKVFWRIGWVQAHFASDVQRLALYAVAGDDTPARAFLPFMDATNAHESYAAGRYMDVVIEGDTAFLDFNTAYHPYCAYSDGWSCPIVPPENRLKIAVRAGEHL